MIPMHNPTPSVGRVVHVLVDPDDNNGSDVAPAVVVRVWPNGLVNLQVLPDGPEPRWATSVPLHADAATAREHGGTPAAFWPPRV